MKYELLFFIKEVKNFFKNCHYKIMKRKSYDLQKVLKKNSAKHHYIPRFLSNGFTNAEGLLFIYDKEKDKINRNPRSTRSIFYEEDRNTIEISDYIKSSIIEDFYSKIDNNASKILKVFQNERLNNIEFTTDNISQLLYFLITLFWRIPKSDFAAQDLLDRAEIIGEGIDPEFIRNNPAFRKIKRFGIAKHHIDEIKKYGLKGKRFINIHQSDKEIYVIGDYPILFRRNHSLFKEFNDIDILFAVSSKRMYSSTMGKIENLTDANSLRYNAAIIEQSIRYIGCCSYEVLKYSVEFYKEIKNRGLIYGIAEKAFQTN